MRWSFVEARILEETYNVVMVMMVELFSSVVETILMGSSSVGSADRQKPRHTMSQLA